MNSIERMMIMQNVQCFYDMLGEWRGVICPQLMHRSARPVLPCASRLAGVLGSPSILSAGYGTQSTLPSLGRLPLLAAFPSPPCMISPSVLAGMCERIMRTPMPIPYTR